MRWNGESGKLKQPGTVYLMYWTVSGEYKIGFTGDLDRRLNKQLVYTYRGIRLLHTFPADKMIYGESKLQWAFDHKRAEPGTGGDWFNLTDDDVESIKSIESYQDGEFFTSKGIWESQYHEAVR